LQGHTQAHLSLIILLWQVVLAVAVAVAVLVVIAQRQTFF
jgi:hypothetical protein